MEGRKPPSSPPPGRQSGEGAPGARFGPAQPSEQQPAPPRSPGLSRDPRAAAKPGLRCREAVWGRREALHGGTWVRGPAAPLAPLLAVPDERGWGGRRCGTQPGGAERSPRYLPCRALRRRAPCEQ